MSAEEMKACVAMFEALRERGQHKCSAFLKPVTEEQAPGYSRAIAKPMDLATCDKNLRRGMYKDVHELAADVRLVFTNAMVYNKEQSVLYTWADDLLQTFNDIYQTACVDLQTDYRETPPLTVALLPAPATSKVAAMKKGGGTKSKKNQGPVPPHVKAKHAREVKTLTSSLTDAQAENARLRQELEGVRARCIELEKEVTVLLGRSEDAGTGPDRELLKRYISVFQKSGVPALMQGVGQTLKRCIPSFGMDGDFDMHVYSYTDATVRALIAFCEPHFEETDATDSQEPGDPNQGHKQPIMNVKVPPAVAAAAAAAVAVTDNMDAAGATEDLGEMDKMDEVEDEEPAVAATAANWRTPPEQGQGARGPENGGSMEEEKEALWKNARAMKEAEMELEKQKEQEEALRQQTLEHEREKRHAQQQEDFERKEQEKQAEEETRKQQEESQQQKEIEQAREKARLERRGKWRL